MDLFSGKDAAKIKLYRALRGATGNSVEDESDVVKKIEKSLGHLLRREAQLVLT